MDKNNVEQILSQIKYRGVLEFIKTLEHNTLLGLNVGDFQHLSKSQKDVLVEWVNSGIPYNNDITGIPAETIQEAIDHISIGVASGSFDNTNSPIGGSTIDSAIREFANRYNNIIYVSKSREHENIVRNGSQNAPFSTIQEAIDSSPLSGALIFVSNNSYFENITIDKPVTLVGLGGVTLRGNMTINVEHENMLDRYTIVENFRFVENVGVITTLSRSCFKGCSFSNRVNIQSEVRAYDSAFSRNANSSNNKLIVVSNGGHLHLANCMVTSVGNVDPVEVSNGRLNIFKSYLAIPISKVQYNVISVSGPESRLCINYSILRHDSASTNGTTISITNPGTHAKDTNMLFNTLSYGDVGLGASHTIVDGLEIFNFALTGTNIILRRADHISFNDSDSNIGAATVQEAIDAIHFEIVNSLNPDASEIDFNNVGNPLNSTNVQSAIEEVITYIIGLGYTQLQDGTESGQVLVWNNFTTEWEPSNLNITNAYANTDNIVSEFLDFISGEISEPVIENKLSHVIMSVAYLTHINFIADDIEDMVNDKIDAIGLPDIEFGQEDGQMLVWDSTDGWKAQFVETAGINVSGTDDGDILIWDSTGDEWISSQLDISNAYVDMQEYANLFEFVMDSEENIILDIFENPQNYNSYFYNTLLSSFLTFLFVGESIENDIAYQLEIALDQLTEVDPGTEDNQILYWNNSESKWSPGVLDIPEFNLPEGTTGGDILVWDSTSEEWVIQNLDTIISEIELLEGPEGPEGPQGPPGPPGSGEGASVPPGTNDGDILIWDSTGEDYVSSHLDITNAYVDIQSWMNKITNIFSEDISPEDIVENPQNYNEYIYSIMLIAAIIDERFKEDVEYQLELALDQLTEVDPGTEEGQILYWNNSETKWEPGNLDIPEFTLPSGTDDGDILIWDSTGEEYISSHLDITNAYTNMSDWLARLVNILSTIELDDISQNPQNYNEHIYTSIVTTSMIFSTFMDSIIEGVMYQVGLEMDQLTEVDPGTEEGQILLWDSTENKWVPNTFDITTAYIDGDSLFGEGSEITNLQTLLASFHMAISPLGDFVETFDIDTPTTGDILTYDGVSEKWINVNRSNMEITSDAAFTLNMSHIYSDVFIAGTGETTVTIPFHTSDDLPIGYRVRIFNGDEFRVIFSCNGDTALLGKNSTMAQILELDNQFGYVELTKVENKGEGAEPNPPFDVWIITGDFQAYTE